MMLLGAMFLAGCSMDNRIIEKPVFLASNTTGIEVSKVTLTDSTTVLLFSRVWVSNWTRNYKEARGVVGRIQEK